MINNWIGTVLSLKLVTGEEIVTKLINVQDDMLVLDNPVFIARGQHGFQFAPGMVTCPQETVYFNKHHVMMFGVTDENIKMKYIEATTGIKLPEKKIFLGS